MSAPLGRVPRTIIRYRDGQLVTVALDSVAPGDRLLVQAGETVPVDGIVQDGIAVLDESALTGEPIPVTRETGAVARSERDEAAKRFFHKALAQPHTVVPRTITVDRNAAYPKAFVEMKKHGELRRCSGLREVKYLNNIVEQDHRRIKRLVRPGLALAASGRPDEHWQALRRWR